MTSSSLDIHCRRKSAHPPLGSNGQFYPQQNQLLSATSSKSCRKSVHAVECGFCPTPLTFIWTNAYAKKCMRHVQVLGFDWDDGNREKCQKHGLALEEIEAFFRQERLYVAPDIAHSQEEQRLFAVGRCPRNGRPMCIVFTLREQYFGHFLSEGA